MHRPHLNEKGIVLYLVLGILLVVVVLANVILAIISSQSRLTHHQVSRIQAYYASQAGMVYAMEKLRVGNDSNWPLPSSGSSYTHNLCRGCNGPGDINESELPASIANVAIKVADKDAAGCDPPSGISICISTTATYTYTP